MLLLASYFPYRMCRETDGTWSFWNRNGFPVGVNLSEGERRWTELWDGYPPRTMELAGIDEAALRKLCWPEWLVAEGALRDEDSVDLYGTTSNPGASEENMAAYLNRLRILMEAGALRTLFPYGMELQRDGSWVFFNRNYKPVGVNLGVGPGTWIVYADWPVGVRLTGVDRRTLADLSYTGVYDEEWEIPGQALHFYEDTSVPTDSARNMDTYQSKLRTLAVLDGRTNSRAPWRYRVRRFVRKTVADVRPGAVASTLLKLWRP